MRRSSLTWLEFNEEDHAGYYNYPAVYYHWLHKNFAKVTAGKSEAEVADIQKALERLETYKRTLDIMDYASSIGIQLGVLNIRMAKNNISNPVNIVRYSTSDSTENCLIDLETLARGYY